MDQIVLFGDSLTQFSGDQSNGFAFKAAVENGKLTTVDHSITRRHSEQI